MRPPDARKLAGDDVFMQYTIYMSVVCFVIVMVGGAVNLNGDDGNRGDLVHCFCPRCSANVQLRCDVSAGLVPAVTSRRHRRLFGEGPMKPLPTTADPAYITATYERALGILPGSLLRGTGTGADPCLRACLHPSLLSPSPRHSIPNGLPQATPLRHPTLTTLTLRPKCCRNQTIPKVGIRTRGKGRQTDYHAAPPPSCYSHARRNVLHCLFNHDLPPPFVRTPRLG